MKSILAKLHSLDPKNDSADTVIVPIKSDPYFLGIVVERATKHACDDHGPDYATALEVSAKVLDAMPICLATKLAACGVMVNLITQLMQEEIAEDEMLEKECGDLLSKVQDILSGKGGKRDAV